jgi:hypothetical protein
MAASPIAGGWLDVTKSKMREVASVPPSIAARAGAPASAPLGETVVLPSLSRMYTRMYANCSPQRHRQSVKARRLGD